MCAINMSVSPTVEARDRLQNSIDVVMNSLGISSSISLEKPPKGMGDFALPCFGFAKVLKRSPVDIAGNIKHVLDESRFDGLRKAFIIRQNGPYVNFTFRSAYLLENVICSILGQGVDYGSFSERDEFVILEHTSANPNGPFHVGRARNPIIGDTVARILRKLGFTVEVQYWVNDMGRQAATLAWGKMNVPETSVPSSDTDDPYIDKNDHMLVKYYQEAYRRITEEPDLTKEIDEILYEIEAGNEEIKKIVRNYSTMVLAGMKESLTAINIHHDRFVWESSSVEDGTVTEVIDRLKGSKYAFQEDGAWYLELEEFGITGRSTRFFFTRRDGTSLYTTRDLAYHLWKLRRSDRAINVLGEDHKLQARQLEIALELMGSEQLPESIFYSFVALEQGKMSTRKGNVVYLDDLIQEAFHRAFEEVSKRRPELDQEQKKEIARAVGIGCIRYNIIRVQSDKRIMFRWNEALNFEGDSSPFLQYAHARCCGIIEKAENGGLHVPSHDESDDLFAGHELPEIHDNERKLLGLLADFPEVIEEAGMAFKPHLLARYLHDLASTFNNFYQSCPVIPETDNTKRFVRLGLVQCIRIVLAEGLGLLGIDAPRSM